jgi:hypothetical protein
MKATLLLVGCDVERVEGVRRVLTGAGFTVEVSYDAEVALRLIDEHGPAAVVVTDEMQPDEHADRFVQRVTALPSQPCVVSVPRERYRLFEKRGAEFYELCDLGYCPDMHVPWAGPEDDADLLRFISRVVTPTG